jgi:signal transduction histidine kinase
MNTDRIRVLLVEDDEDDYILTRYLLSSIGEGSFDLDWVKYYDVALEKLSEEDYDICLFDYWLGSHSGLELLKAVRAIGNTVPVILLTGQGDKEVDVEAMKAGAADYLVKGQIDALLLERSIRYSLEQKRIEEERIQHTREQEARAQAEAANKAKDEFLAMVSHELKTPVNTMLGWTQLLRMGNLNEEMFTRALEAIERSAKMQAQLVEDLLDVTRIANGNIKIEKQKVDFSQILKAVTDEMRPSADNKNISFIVSFSENQDICPVSGDSVRLRQIITNLLSNAFKFTPENGRVETTLRQKDKEIEFKVIDTGRGIEKEFLPFVFDRYRQNKDADSRKYGGLGLGLSIVRQLVELHGGRIIAESPGKDQGAVFTVIFPCL